MEFYRDMLGLPLPEERHDDTEPRWGAGWGDVHFAIHPLRTTQTTPASGPGHMPADVATQCSLVRIVGRCFAVLYGQIQASAVGHSPLP